tara:strand:- start:2266 stop:2877 length:612 start_codon:yes stop_codon:yes gene_type:complete
MHNSFLEQINIKGHLTIHKVANGEEELVYDEDNVITSGFGYSLSHLFGLAGGTDITDYQIDRFQLGVSGGPAVQVSSTFELSGPLSSVAEYTTNGDSNLNALESKQYKNATSPNAIFAKIPFTKVTRIDSRTVRYTIFIDEDSCNNLARVADEVSLNEIALFVKNPTGNTVNDVSVMAAYRYFSNIRKTNQFGLVFRWTITFG